MANICCITNELLNSSKSLSDFKPYKGRLSREDVATLIETFEFAISEVPVELFVDVLKNSDGYFAFLVNRGGDGSFDFYKYLNDYYSGNTVVSPVNAKLVFSRALSRGIYSEYTDSNVDDEPSSELDDEGATGFMDEDDLPISRTSVVAKLKHVRTNSTINITREGTLIGRSQKTADFVLHGNTNISRPHAKVYLKGNSAMISDENSKNGTFVNGEKVYPGRDTALSDGDVVMLADEKFVAYIE